MIKLDKKKSYYLCDLSEEQKDTLCKESGTKEYNRRNLDVWSYMCFDKKYNMWLYGDEPYYEVVNALELFYTLENIQVDCRELSEEQIKEMCKVYDSNGYKLWGGYVPLKIADNFHYFRLHTNNTNMYLVDEISEEKHTITYDKFMELFSKE
ncbi:MAG: hypothetical protein ACRCVV_06240, partial [Shewanella sp.]